MMMAAMPAADTLARSPLISQEMLPGPPAQPGIAGGPAVDLGLVVAAADRLDLGADLRAEVVGQRHAVILHHS